MSHGKCSILDEAASSNALRRHGPLDWDVAQRIPKPDNLSLVTTRAVGRRWSCALTTMEVIHPRQTPPNVDNVGWYGAGAIQNPHTLEREAFAQGGLVGDDLFVVPPGALRVSMKSRNGGSAGPHARICVASSVEAHNLVALAVISDQTHEEEFVCKHRTRYRTRSVTSFAGFIRQNMEDCAQLAVQQDGRENRRAQEQRYLHV